MKGIIRRRGMDFCQACGELASPGSEEWDWCDHVTGADCANMPDEDEDYDAEYEDYYGDEYDDFRPASPSYDAELTASDLKSWNEMVRKFNERQQR